MVFCFVQNFFFEQHESSNIYFFCRSKRENFFQNLTVDYMTKTLNQIIFFPSTKIRIFFSATLGIRIFFLEKNHTPPFKLNGRSLTILNYFRQILVAFKYFVQTDWLIIVHNLELPYTIKLKTQVVTDRVPSGFKWDSCCSIFSFLCSFL